MVWWMDRRFVIRAIQVSIFTIVMVAVAQELSKPREERSWHGKVLSIVPYDFRLPTLERIRDCYWNQYETHLITPQFFGVGWGINLHALFENLGLIHKPYLSEESFLMPNRRIRQLLKQQDL